jgi:hypothetical protein
MDQRDLDYFEKFDRNEIKDDNICVNKS